MRFSHPPLSLATTHGITFCFLLLRVLRCFTSPRSPSPAIYSPVSDTTSLVPGFPIRTSSDPRSVDSSPRHIAASHVLHRLPMPRHPPCALTHLHTQKPRTKNCNTNKPPTQRRACLLDARNHYPQIKDHTPPPSGATTRGRVASGPNSVPNPQPGAGHQKHQTLPAVDDPLAVAHNICTTG